MTQEYSYHYKEERKNREDLIKNVIGYGKPIKQIIAPARDRDTNLIYEISDTGIVTIFDERTLRIITKLIARPNQIRKYYKDEKAPQFLINLAIKHKRLAHNEV